MKRKNGKLLELEHDIPGAAVLRYPKGRLTQLQREMEAACDAFWAQRGKNPYGGEIGQLTGLRRSQKIGVLEAMKKRK